MADKASRHADNVLCVEITAFSVRQWTCALQSAHCKQCISPPVEFDYNAFTQACLSTYCMQHGSEMMMLCLQMKRNRSRSLQDIEEEDC